LLRGEEDGRELEGLRVIKRDLKAVDALGGEVEAVEAIGVGDLALLVGTLCEGFGGDKLVGL
jgi:hypothetical protein